MRVKHKDTKKEHLNMSMALSHWQKEYFPNKKYLNYEFYDVPDIFDLYEIDKTNGNLTYVTSDFASHIFPKVRENPKRLVYKEHDPKYLDEYLMPKKLDYLGVSFFNRIKAKIKQIISPRQNTTAIPFSRFELTTVRIGVITIIVAFSIPVILFFIDKIYF
ncbi:MAG: hypothetical protein JJE07_01305 [Flavobacteriaceae bacterium]|nr:hypothetical protein [Flavobacteriaceae bacterium]